MDRPTNPRRVRILLASAVLLALCLACGGNLNPPRAQVNCEGQGDAYNCTVTHSGGGEGQVCWDIRATCANGTVTTANSCVQLTTGATVSHRVPVTEFSPSFVGCVVSTLEIVDTTGT